MSVAACVVAIAVVSWQEPGGAGLDFSEPVVCRSIKGYEDYVPLDEPVVSRTEKVLIYTRPTGYEYVREKDGYRFHLVEDVKVRRKGQKNTLWGRKRIVEYAGTSPRPPLYLYLETSLGLKEFEAGEYEADLILYDEIGKTGPVQRTVSFRLTEPPNPRPVEEPGVTPAEPPRGRAGK